MKFIVKVQEIHHAHFEIEADSKEAALSMVEDGAGDLVHTEYSHTLEKDLWEVSRP